MPNPPDPSPDSSPDSAPKPSVLIVMGVSGSGKTTVGRLLAERLNWDYAEADEFHPASNVAKMAAGEPLTDADRSPWIDDIAGWIGDRLDAGQTGVVSCSALKRAYRDRLTHGRRPGVRVVYLSGDRDEIARRMRARIGHFFKAGLLDSQFRDLEPPAPDEHALHIPTDEPPERLTERILIELGFRRPGR